MPTPRSIYTWISIVLAGFGILAFALQIPVLFIPLLVAACFSAVLSQFDTRG